MPTGPTNAHPLEPAAALPKPVPVAVPWCCQWRQPGLRKARRAAGGVADVDRLRLCAQRSAEVARFTVVGSTRPLRHPAAGLDGQPFLAVRVDRRQGRCRWPSEVNWIASVPVVDPGHTTGARHRQRGSVGTPRRSGWLPRLVVSVNAVPLSVAMTQPKAFGIGSRHGVGHPPRLALRRRAADAEVARPVRTRRPGP